MKAFARNFVRTGLIFGLLMGLFYGFQYGVWSGLIRGLLSGIAFGFVMSVVVSFLMKQTEKERPDFSGETIIKQSPANRVIQGYATGGLIYLTEKQLHFQPHKSQWKAKIVSIPISDISNAKKISDPTVLAGKLEIEQTHGIADKFVIDDAEDWVSTINDTRRHYLDSPMSEDSRLFP